MKLLNFKLQSDIERLSRNKPTTFFKEYLKGLLQDPVTSYFKKCDYVGLSLAEVQNKIDSLADDIAKLQAYKQELSEALLIAKEITAEIFTANGIDRIDGNIISSLTLTKPSVKTKFQIKVKDEDALLRLGYVRYEIDTKALETAVSDGKTDEIKDFIEISTITTTTPAKVKINQKRDVLQSNYNEFNTNNEFLQAV